MCTIETKQIRPTEERRGGIGKDKPVEGRSVMDETLW
jgi:hypothetical protein